MEGWTSAPRSRSEPFTNGTHFCVLRRPSKQMMDQKGPTYSLTGTWKDERGMRSAGYEKRPPRLMPAAQRFTVSRMRRLRVSSRLA